MRRSRSRPGDHLMIDDRTGFTIWASDAQKEWTGVLVHRRVWEARHSQDFVRGVRDDMRVNDPRPDRSIENSNFVGPLITEIAEDVPGNDNEFAPMGPLGAFALGQTDDAGTNEIESNAAGSISITVDSTSGMSNHDRIGVMLDTGDLFLTSIAYITSSSTLQMTQALPGSVSVGNRVFDYTSAT